MYAFTTEIIGALAGVLTTIAFLPQVLRTWQTRSAGDISFAWLGTFVAGLMLWFIYGVLIVSWPVIVANSVTIALVLTILGLKISEHRGLARAQVKEVG